MDWRLLSSAAKLLLVLILCICTCIPVSNGQTTGCKQNINFPVEIAFLIDASDKDDDVYGNVSWPNIVIFAQQVMYSAFRDTSNRLAYVTYADQPAVHAFLDTWPYGVDYFATNMGDIELSGGPSADLAAALDVARIQVLGRPSVRSNAWKIAFIVTDHLPSLASSPRLRTAVVNARSEGIRLLVVGINVTAGAIDYNTLRFIGQNGLNSFYTTVNGYESLNTPSDGFANSVGNWMSFCNVPLSYACQAQFEDLVFVLDTSAIKPSQSAWSNELSFILSVISGFDYFAASSVRIGLVRYDDQSASTQIELDWQNYYTSDKAQLNQAVNSIGLSKGNASNLANALRHLRSNFDSSTSPGSWKVAVVLTDNLPSTTNVSALLAQADLTKAGGWQIITVGINYHDQVDIDLLKKVSGPLDGKMVHTTDYAQLPSAVPAAVQLACFLGYYQSTVSNATQTPADQPLGSDEASWKPPIIAIGVIACFSLLLHVVGVVIYIQLFFYVRKLVTKEKDQTKGTTSVKTRQVIVNKSNRNSMHPPVEEDYYGDIDAPPKNEQLDYTPLEAD